MFQELEIPFDPKSKAWSSEDVSKSKRRLQDVHTPSLDRSEGLGMGIDEGGQGIHQGAPFRWGKRAPGRGFVGGAGSRDGGVDIGCRGGMDGDYGGFVAGG